MACVKHPPTRENVGMVAHFQQISDPFQLNDLPCMVKTIAGSISKKCSIWFPMLIDSFYLFSNPPQRTAPQNWYVHFRAGKWCCCMAPLRTWIATATSNLANNGATFLVPQKPDEKISSPLLRWNSAEQHLMLITNPVKKDNTQCWIVSFSVAWK